MSITFISRLTDAGATAFANAVGQPNTINITEWRLGADSNITLSGGLTDVVNQVDSGTNAEIEFDVLSAGQIIIRVILEEARGPYDFGNLGLFDSSGNLLVISTFSEDVPKSANGVGVVGNRYVLSVPIDVANAEEAVNFSLFSGTFSSWPFVETLADLPAPGISAFEGYIVRDDPSQNRPITAIRNENPTGSGTFVWTLDFHNIITADSGDILNNSYEISTANGDHSWNRAGTQRLFLDGSTFKLGDDTTIAPSSLYNDYVIDGGASTTGISILNTANAGVVFGDAGDSILGGLFKIDSTKYISLSGSSADFDIVVESYKDVNFNIDSLSTGNPHSFIWGKNRFGTSGGVNLMSLDDDALLTLLGNMQIGAQVVGSIVPNTTSDDLVLAGSGSTGITILSDGGNGYLDFGSHSQNVTEADLLRLEFNTTGTQSINLGFSGTSGLEVTADALKIRDGSDAAPGLTFISENDTGWNLRASGVVGLSLTGSLRYQQSSQSADFFCHDFSIGHETRRGSPGRALVDDTNTLALNYEDGGGTPEWSITRIYGDTLRISAPITTVDSGTVSLPAGVLATPSLNFGTANTGIYAPAAGRLGLGASGSLMVELIPGSRVSMPVGISVGSNVAPSTIVDMRGYTRDYKGYCDGAASAEVVPNGMSVDRVSAGVYRLNHNLGNLSLPQMCLSVQPINNVEGVHAQTTGASINYIEYSVVDSSDSVTTFIDSDHHIFFGTLG